jgi:hypothetical protein
VLAWLSDNDFEAAKLLLRDIQAREAAISTKTLSDKLDEVFRLVSTATGHAVNGSSTIELPCGLVEIHVTPHRLGGRKVEDNGKPAERGIVPVGKPIQPQTGISIRNHQDITREILNFLPKEQAEELAKTAADELLRIQIQELESQKDQAEVGQKVDEALRVMEKADRSQRTSVNFQTEHKTAKGNTTISVQSKGSCFVATACYGDSVVRYYGFRGPTS